MTKDDTACWRQEIDGIDKEILSLLNRRARCAVKIGQAKRARGEPIHDPQREEAVKLSLRSRNEGPLSHSAVEKIFGEIISACRLLEEDQSEKRGTS